MLRRALGVRQILSLMCVAVASDGYNTLAMLRRRRSESLIQILIRLDQAIAMANDEDVNNVDLGENIAAIVDHLALVEGAVAVVLIDVRRVHVRIDQRGTLAPDAKGAGVLYGGVPVDNELGMRSR